MKVLNLYAGIGGNRILWDEVMDVDVTAVEIDCEIAKVYQDFFPDDEVIVADAHKYLKEKYDDGWDFVWASPPCPTHSYIRKVAGVGRGQNRMVYPDMKLYEYILFMRGVDRSGGTNFEGKYCIENVESWYDPLIKPQMVGRHYLWANYPLPDKTIPVLPEKYRSSVKGLEKFYGFDLSGYDNIDKKQVLRNCVHPELGKHILKSAFKNKQITLDKISEEVKV